MVVIQSVFHSFWTWDNDYNRVKVENQFVYGHVSSMLLHTIIEVSNNPLNPYQVISAILRCEVLQSNWKVVTNLTAPYSLMKLLEVLIVISIIVLRLNHDGFFFCFVFCFLLLLLLLLCYVFFCLFVCFVFTWPMVIIIIIVMSQSFLYIQGTIYLLRA